jgi:tyrosinase
VIPKLFEGKDNPLASADVSPLALQQGETGCRPGPGAGGRLWSATADTDEVSRLLKTGTSELLERTGGFHDNVHMWVGGHMGQIPYAAFDPIFWAHHTMVDRLWRVWQLRHATAAVPSSILDRALPPFRMTVRQTWT